MLRLGHTHTHTHAQRKQFNLLSRYASQPLTHTDRTPPSPHTHISRLRDCFALLSFAFGISPPPTRPTPALFEMGQRAFDTTLCKLRLRVDICVSAIAHICSRPVSRVRVRVQVLLPLLANYNRRIWLLSIAESFCLINGQRLRTFNVFTLAIDSQPQTGRDGMEEADADASSFSSSFPCALLIPAPSPRLFRSRGCLAGWTRFCYQEKQKPSKRKAK